MSNKRQRSSEPKEVDIFSDSEIKYKGNLEGACEIPECRIASNESLETEYRDFLEEKIWIPQEEVNKWVPAYVQMARSCMTFNQIEQGIPKLDAWENSTNSDAEQYILTVLHDSEYVRETALSTLLHKDLPQQFTTRWMSEEIDQFVRGLSEHGKDFSTIQREILPHKDMKDILSFYYAWKHTKLGRLLKAKICPNGWRRMVKRRRTGQKGKSSTSSADCIINSPSESRVVTRSAAAALASAEK